MGLGFMVQGTHVLDAFVSEAMRFKKLARVGLGSTWTPKVGKILAHNP